MDVSLVDRLKHAVGLDDLAQAGVGNQLLRALPEQDYALLRPHLRRVAVASGEQLAASGAPIAQVCFPEGGLAGFVDVLADGRHVAVGLAGREGSTGWPLLLGRHRWPHEVVARGPDANVVIIDAAALRTLLDRSSSLQRLLLHHVASFVTQMADTIASNLVQSVEQRTARWLLMYHDRIDGDELVMTHDELGAMLGVRRASITDALHQLEGHGAIRSLRGRLLIRDRTSLVALAGETYGRAEAESARLLGSS